MFKVSLFPDRPELVTLIGQDGHVWFRANDIGKFLEYKNTSGFAKRYAAMYSSEVIPEFWRPLFKKHFLVFSLTDVLHLMKFLRRFDPNTFQLIWNTGILKKTCEPFITTSMKFCPSVEMDWANQTNVETFNQWLDRFKHMALQFYETRNLDIVLHNNTQDTTQDTCMMEERIMEMDCYTTMCAEPTEIILTVNRNNEKVRISYKPEPYVKIQNNFCTPVAYLDCEEISPNCSGLANHQTDCPMEVQLSDVNLLLGLENALVKEPSEEVHDVEPSVDEVPDVEPSVDEVSDMEPSVEEMSVDEPSVEEPNVEPPKKSLPRSGKKLELLEKCRIIDKLYYHLESPIICCARSNYYVVSNGITSLKNVRMDFLSNTIFEMRGSNIIFTDKLSQEIWMQNRKQLLPRVVFDLPLKQEEPEALVEAVHHSLYGEDLRTVNSNKYVTRYYSTLAVCMNPGTSTFTNGRISLSVKGYLTNNQLREKILSMRTDRIVTTNHFTASRVKLIQFRNKIKYIHLDKQEHCYMCNSNNCTDFNAIEAIKTILKINTEHIPH